MKRGEVGVVAKMIVAVPLAARTCWLGQHCVEYLCTKALRLLLIPLPFLKHRRHPLSLSQALLARLCFPGCEQLLLCEDQRIHPISLPTASQA